MIVVEQRSNIGTITLSNPEKRNRLTVSAMQDMTRRLKELNSNPEVRVVVITGAGDKAFCAGADLGEFKKSGIMYQRSQNEAYRGLCLALHGMQKPVLAKVNGIAVAGGMALVTLSHLAIASENAHFGTPEISVGAFPNMVMASILRGITKKAAMKLILLGEMVDAEEALSMGLINAVVSKEMLDEAIMEIAAKLVAKSPSVLSLGLDSIRVSSDLPYPQALEYLQEMATLIRSTEDCQEGAQAFLEKRDPRWIGL